MDDRYLATLEFPKILDRLAKLTSFSAGRDLALALRPAGAYAEATRAQTTTAEARRLFELKPDASIGGARDVRDPADRAARGALLDPTTLLEVQATLASGRLLRGVVTRFATELPELHAIALRIRPLPGIEQEIGRCLSDRGEMLDSASPALAQVRHDIRSAHARLQSKLAEILHAAAAQNLVQDAIITIREGRYVLPIRADSRSHFRGVVHDTSASGQTLFVEPLAAVDLNNRWRELQIEEQREIERILRRLSQLVGTSSDLIHGNVEALAELDLAFARAKLADRMHAIAPKLLQLPERGEGGAPAAGSTELARPASNSLARRPLRLFNARHPLLTGDVVPITLSLGEDFFVLVVTGPNTGGKTVALKTVGLLAAMAQAGLQIPADEGSELPVFDAIYADIGDEQSIEQSLSTFSSHVRNIIAILGKATSHSLVLLDELGAGTDPTEGSALARAILEHLLARGVATIATTHYSELKAFAHTRPGAANASVEFNLETLSPTYRLSVGLPGQSMALAIATRLGLPAEIVEAARELVSPVERETESLLAQIRKDREEAAALRAEQDRRRGEVARQEVRLREQLRRVEDERRELRERALAQVEAEAAALRGRLREAAARLEAAETAAQVAEAARATQEVAATVEQRLVSTRARPAPPARPRPSTVRKRRDLKVGDAVWVPHLQQAGTLLTPANERGEVDVQLGAMRLRTKLSGLEGAEGREVVASSPLLAPAPVLASRPPSPGLELHLRGRRAEEVLPDLERYLNDAYLSGMPFVRIVHGKGTGVLRDLVRRELAASPLVKSFGPADLRDGGEGVTIAYLAN